ncbi:MAG: ACP S-malonyltransferase [Aureliella sp.]
MKIGLLFPGQGAQVVGMGGVLASRSAAARGMFELAQQVLGFDLLKLCAEGPADKLNRTEYSQPALFVHSMAALRQLEADRPNVWDEVLAVAGLSLGEYTAVAAAGGIDFEAGLRLVQLRGTAMQQAADAVPSGMSSVIGLERERLEAICTAATSGPHLVRVANLLCPGNIAISGHLEALEAAERLSVEAGAIKTIRLPVAGAFHTPIMQPAVDKLSAALESVDFRITRVPVFSNVDALPHTQPTEFRRLLSEQVIDPVLWESSLENMLAAGCEQFIEVGTGRILAGTLKRIRRKISCENVGDS